MGDSRAIQDSAAASQFPGTRWSVVLQAQMGDALQANEALEEICKRYWYPIYAFLRKKGHRSADAQDLTQGFFGRLLSEDTLQRVDQDRGKLRSFLLADLKRFLVDESRRRNAQKRGGGQVNIAIDEALAEARFAEAFTDSRSDPESWFEKAWASDLFGGVLETLAERYAKSGKGEIFDALRELLLGGDTGVTYGEIGAKLGLSSGALRLQVMRMRKAFREQLEREIAETVETREEIEEEMRYLARILRS